MGARAPCYDAAIPNEEDGVRLVFLGPPGAGKGTIAAKAREALGIAHISTGELFRKAIAEGSPLGLKVKGVIESGGLVGDDLTIALVRERLDRPDAGKGFILDGFPRTVAQAEALESMGGLDRAVDFKLDDALVLARLGGRRTCPSCAKTYHVLFQKPRSEGVCDACGATLTIRDDDREEAIKLRLEVYRAQTAPLIEWYEARGLLLGIDASPAPDAVLADFLAKIGGGPGR